MRFEGSRSRSPPPGTTTALVQDAFKSAAWGVVLVGVPVGQTRFGMRGGRSRCGPRSPSRPSHTCVQVRVGPPATRSDPARPADTVLAVAGCRPSYPSCIRVQRVATPPTPGPAGRWARCPATAGAAPEHCVRSARPARAGRSVGSRSPGS